MNRHVSVRTKTAAPAVSQGRLKNSRNFAERMAEAKRILAKAQLITIHDTKTVRLMKEELRVRFGKHGDTPRWLLDSIGTLGQIHRALVRRAPKYADGTNVEVLDGEARLAGVRVHGLSFKVEVVEYTDDDLVPFLIAATANANQREFSIEEKTRIVVMLHEGEGADFKDIARFGVLRHGEEYLELLYRLRKLEPDVWRYANEDIAPEGRTLPVNVLAALATTQPDAQLQWAKVAHREKLAASDLNARIHAKGEKLIRGVSPERRYGSPQTGQRAVKLAAKVEETVKAIDDMLKDEELESPLPKGHPYAALARSLEAAKQRIDAVLKRIGPVKKS